jgi:hypothetical protein
VLLPARGRSRKIGPFATIFVHRHGMLILKKPLDLPVTETGTL